MCGNVNTFTQQTEYSLILMYLNRKNIMLDGFTVSPVRPS